MVRGSWKEALDLGSVLFSTRQQSVIITLRELVLPADSVSYRLASQSDVTNDLSEPQLTSSKTELYLQLIDH